MNPRSLIRAASIVLLSTLSAVRGDVTILTNLPYKAEAAADDYQRERCRLDLYLPEGTGFPSLVWFHGGGLVGGNKDGARSLGRSFAEEGVAVAAVNYRLSPKVKFPAYVEDAAAAVAWTCATIGGHGGASNRVFVSGASAGGYLTSMIAMDASYLRRHGLDPSSLAGFIPVSGQMVTHFTVRSERGLGTNTIVADAAAPIHHTRPDGPPMLVIMGDRDWPGRLEENQYFVALQKIAGNRRVEMVVVPDRTHGTICGNVKLPDDPSREAIRRFLAKYGDPAK
jgi:acetyl esterase/lipase